MSHHLDSALSRRDPRLNILDLYAFRGQAGTVLVLDVNTSKAGDAAPRGFHPEGRYEFKIDTDGDAVEDLTYRAAFGAPDGDGRQPFNLYRLSGPTASSDSEAGELIASGLTGTDVLGDGGLRVWAGGAGEPFFIDPTVLGAVATAFKNGERANLTGWTPAAAIDVFSGTFVSSIVLEIPDSQLSGSIGIWSVTSLATDAGGWRQINRAGKPMIQPIFNGDGNEAASVYNTTAPVDDRRLYRDTFINKVAAVVAAYGSADDPVDHATRVVDLLLPDVLPYQVGTPANYGFAGFNGRSLSDNVPEIMYSMVTNSALPVGLDRHDATGLPRDEFPYVAAKVFERALAAV